MIGNGMSNSQNHDIIDIWMILKHENFTSALPSYSTDTTKLIRHSSAGTRTSPARRLLGKRSDVTITFTMISFRIIVSFVLIHLNQFHFIFIAISIVLSQVVWIVIRIVVINILIILTVLIPAMIVTLCTWDVSEKKCPQVSESVGVWCTALISVCGVLGAVIQNVATEKVLVRYPIRPKKKYDHKFGRKNSTLFRNCFDTFLWVMSRELWLW